MDKIIGMGNVLVDILAHIESDDVLAEMNLPKGSMQLIDKDRYTEVSKRINALNPSLASGGSAANTIIALARLGNTPALIGKIGNDEHGEFYETICRQAGAETHFLHSDTSTGIASTFISTDGQRTFATYLGAAAELAPSELCDKMFEGYKYLYLEGYLVQNHPLMDRAAELARSRGIKICLDMASYNIVEADREYFTYFVKNYVDIVFANEEESRAFTGLAPREALDAIAADCDIAVVKLGAQGSTAAKKATAGNMAETASCPAGKVSHIVDTTAAGDFFAAGFLHALSRGCTLKACLEAGTVLSTEVIQVVGTTLSAERWNDIRRRVNDICK